MDKLKSTNCGSGNDEASATEKCENNQTQSPQFEDVAGDNAIMVGGQALTAEDEQYILENQDMRMQLLKWVVDKYGCGLKEAIDVINKVLAKNGGESEEASAEGAAADNSVEEDAAPRFAQADSAVQQDDEKISITYDDERKILELQDNPSEAVEWIADKYGCDKDAAKDIVNSVLVKHTVAKTGKSGCMFTFVLLGLISFTLLYFL